MNIEQQIENLRKQAEQPNVAAQVSTNLSFVASTELVELPSKGFFYPEGHPLHKKEFIEIKQMTAKEEDILTNKSFIKKGVVIDRLVESLLIDKGVLVSSLLVGDKNAIMIAARTSAYGPAYDVVATCLDCGSKNELSVNLQELAIRDTVTISQEAETDEGMRHLRMEDGSIMLVLPKSKWEVTCKMLNGDDERKILNILESKKKMINQEPEITLSEQLDIMIQSINGTSDRSVLKDAISLMPAFDAKFLRKTYAKLVPNVAMKKKFTCSSCSGEQELEVPFTQEFFWPK